MSNRVLVWPMSRGASAHYRLRCPAAALQAEGADVAVVGDPQVRAPTVAWRDHWPGDHETEGAPPDAVPLSVGGVDGDVVVLQRPARRWHPRLIGLLHDAGVNVVVDIDDRLDCIHRQSNAFRNYDPDQSPNQNWRWLDAACEAADLVTCTTPSLAERFGFGHGAVLPNLVPASHLAVTAVDPLRRTIVWSGMVSNHRGDLEATEGGVAMALRGTDWAVHHIGDGRDVASGLGVESCTDTGGRIPLRLYPGELARATIGIVPVEDSAFNLGKSALKMTEFAALGVPVVASPIPDHIRVHDLGVGLLARTGAEWHEHMRCLMDHPDLRTELAIHGRAAVATQTYEHQADHWWSAWTNFEP